MQYRPTKNRSAEYRATLSYELDLAKRNRWLGQHSLAGLYQVSRSETSQDLTRVFNLATIGLPASGGWTNNAVDAVNLLRTRVYFVNGNVPTMPDSIQVQNNLNLLNSYGRFVGATANEAVPINLGRQSFLSPQKGKFASDAVSLGWQAKWFGGRLVTVAGYRQDDTKSYSISSQRTVVNPAISGAAADPLKQSFDLAANTPFNPKPSIIANGLSRTYSGVYHAFSWLSLTYSRSNNFLPVPNASWVDALGRSAPNSVGKTTDYGLRFSLWQGKVALGVNRFETSADNQARNANASVGGTRAILTRLRNNYKIPGDPYFAELAAEGGYPVDTGNVSDTWSYVAEGYEMNLVYNPSRNWRVALSGSINTNKLGTHLAAVGTYLYTDSNYQGLGTWKKFASELRKVEAGQASSIFALDPASEPARTQAAADALFIEQQTAAQEKGYLDDVALDGVTTSRSGKYALNGLITRAFHEGKLKGWTVGGNYRWRSAGNIGYQRLVNATGAPVGTIDVSRPLRGKEFWDIGAMLAYQRRVFDNINLRVQLNIQNLPNWQTPRLVRADYDTQAIYGTTNEIVPILWELRRPRNYVLSATFDF